jgi:hypothetical protein
MIFWMPSEWQAGGQVVVIGSGARRRMAEASYTLVHASRSRSVINQWTGPAPYWEKNREMIGHMFAPITRALVEERKIGGGKVV